MIRASKVLPVQIQQATELLKKYVREERFWAYLEQEVKGTNLSEHDLLEDDPEILGHLKYMFACDLNVEVVPYRTRNPFSSVLGYSEGNRVNENSWKFDALKLFERVGHLGHEICHLFGYHHAYQGDKTSVAVVFGNVMEKYAEIRLREVQAA